MLAHQRSIICLTATAAIVSVLLLAAKRSAPTTASPVPTTPTADLSQLQAEVAELRAELFRHRRALKGIAGYMELAEHIAKFGPIARQAEETTGAGVRDILGTDPPGLYKKDRR